MSAPDLCRGSRTRPEAAVPPLAGEPGTNSGAPPGRDSVSSRRIAGANRDHMDAARPSFSSRRDPHWRTRIAHCRNAAPRLLPDALRHRHGSCRRRHNRHAKWASAVSRTASSHTDARTSARHRSSSAGPHASSRLSSWSEAALGDKPPDVRLRAVWRQQQPAPGSQYSRPRRPPTTNAVLANRLSWSQRSSNRQSEGAPPDGSTSVSQAFCPAFVSVGDGRFLDLSAAHWCRRANDLGPVFARRMNNPGRGARPLAQ